MIYNFKYDEWVPVGAWAAIKMNRPMVIVFLHHFSNNGHQMRFDWRKKERGMDRKEVQGCQFFKKNWIILFPNSATLYASSANSFPKGGGGLVPSVSKNLVNPPLIRHLSPFSNQSLSPSRPNPTFVPENFYNFSTFLYIRFRLFLSLKLKSCISCLKTPKNCLNLASKKHILASVGIFFCKSPLIIEPLPPPHQKFTEKKKPWQVPPNQGSACTEVSVEGCCPLQNSEVKNVDYRLIFIISFILIQLK